MVAYYFILVNMNFFYFECIKIPKNFKVSFNNQKLKISHLFLLLVLGFSEITDNYASGSGFFDFFSEIGVGFVHIGLGKPGADFCHRI